MHSASSFVEIQTDRKTDIVPAFLLQNGDLEIRQINPFLLLPMPYIRDKEWIVVIMFKITLLIHAEFLL